MLRRQQLVILKIKIMKNIFLPIVFVLLVFNNQSILAQDNGESGYSDQLASNGSMLMTRGTKKKKVNVEGTPYINEEYLPITISGQNNKNLKAKYNAYNGDMEVLDQAQGVAYVLNKRMTNYDVNFIGQNKVYRSFQYIESGGNTTNDFFVKLTANDKVNLLRKENISYQKEIVAVTTYDKARPARYKRSKDDHYIKIGEDMPVLAPSKKKDISKLFSNNSSDVLKYIKSNKLKLSKEEDLIKLINHINSL